MYQKINVFDAHQQKISDKGFTLIPISIALHEKCVDFDTQTLSVNPTLKFSDEKGTYFTDSRKENISKFIQKGKPEVKKFTFQKALGFESGWRSGTGDFIYENLEIESHFTPLFISDIKSVVERLFPNFEIIGNGGNEIVEQSGASISKIIVDGEREYSSFNAFKIGEGINDRAQINFDLMT